MNELERVTLTDGQRAKLAELIRTDPYRGHVKAARAAGVTGSAGQIRQVLANDEQFQEVLHEARGDLFAEAGLGVKTLLTKLGAIAASEGPSQHRAVMDGLALQGVHAKQVTQLEHTGAGGGPMEVTNPDVAAAIERFTSAVVQLATRNGAGTAGSDAAAGSESRARLPVARLERAP